MTTTARPRRQATYKAIKHAIMSIMAKHHGKDESIHKGELQLSVALTLDYAIDERVIRISVEQLRREGFLICSLNDEGYFMATSQAEVNDFLKAQYGKRLNSMYRTIKAIKQSSRTIFGDAVQVGLPQ